MKPGSCAFALLLLEFLELNWASEESHQPIKNSLLEFLKCLLKDLFWWIHESLASFVSERVDSSLIGSGNPCGLGIWLCLHLGLGLCESQHHPQGPLPTVQNLCSRDSNPCPSSLSQLIILNGICLCELMQNMCILPPLWKEREKRLHE